MASSEENLGLGISSGAMHESTPDLLQNTPSNIAILEDVIEHCEGRQKYLVRTRSPSDGGDVRWYFCKVPLGENELAASVPRSEIVGKGDYFRFGMRDSLAIEAAFLQREEELLSSWWEEYAACSEGPKERPGSSKNLDRQRRESSLEASKSANLHETDEERVGVPVKGGLYEVDLVKRHCFPVYWNGENRRVLRGHWFARKGGLDWLPLREDIAEQLEIAYHRQVWHRRTFQPSGLFAARVDLQGFTPGLHALFTGEDDNWEAWLNSDASGFSSVFGLGGNGIKLRRGYSTSDSPKPTQDELRQQKEEEMDDYCSQVPVQHLVFMVHGIGQRLEKSNLVDDVTNFRHITASLAERHLTSHQRGTQRVLFIPCQWRKGLKLSGETAVDKCTLDGVRGLRVMLGATVHDVLYYMSPIYCQDIINSVSNQLNWLYLKFLRRNPSYNGKVSIYGHSLGSVLSYDILCHQENLSSPFPLDWMYHEHATREEFSSDPNNQSSTSNETVETVHPVDKVMGSGSQMHLVGLGSENPSMVVDSVVSDLDEHLTGAITYNQTSGGDDEYDLRDMSPHKSVCSDEPMNFNYGSVADGALEKNDDHEADDSRNTEVIKSLMEEIDSLKKKIEEFELQCPGTETNGGLGQGYKEITKTMTKESIPEKQPLGQEDGPKNYTPLIKYTKLEFKVDTFFAVGSPLGVFLALRNIRIGIGKGKEYWDEENISEELPACGQMFNIFHPFDPVAYRVEPLVCKEYISKRPVIVPYHKGGKRLHIGFQEFTEDLAVRSQAIMGQLQSVRVKVLTVCQSKKANEVEDEDESPQDKEDNLYGAQMMERLTGSAVGRIDHVLQDITFKHPYLQALGAHTNYWRDNDTALFILKHLYRDIPEDLSLPIGPERFNLKRDHSGPPSWSDPREIVDEELPLTFSDSALVRSFSRKAKKIMEN